MEINTTDSSIILIKSLVIISPLLLLTMYLVGYFEVRMADTMSIGFGAHKLNLLGIIDPVNSIDKFKFQNNSSNAILETTGTL